MENINKSEINSIKDNSSEGIKLQIEFEKWKIEKELDSKKAFYKAFAKAQSEMRPASKESDNPFFKSKYANLASVIEAAGQSLSNNGFSFFQKASLNGKVFSVTTIIAHELGFEIQGTVSCEPKTLVPQEIGSSLTYLKRYGLQALIGIPSVDDDGNKGSLTEELKLEEVKAYLLESNLDISQAEIIYAELISKKKTHDNFENYINKNKVKWYE